MNTSLSMLDCDARYLKALVGGAAAGTAGALDSDRGRSFCITHLQERGEHAPPGHTHTHAQPANTQHLEHFLRNGAMSKPCRMLDGTSHTGAAQALMLG